MSAASTPTPPLNVKIATGPAGRKTVIEIDGQPVKNATSFTLHSDVSGATTLSVSYINVHAEVEALVDTTGSNAEERTYERVTLVGKKEAAHRAVQEVTDAAHTRVEDHPDR